MRSGTRAGLAALMLMAGLVAAPTTGAAQGWVEMPPVGNAPTTLEKTRTEIRVVVDGRVARVEVSEWFRNNGHRVAEGHYLYPLPGEAVFQGFSLFQGDAELRGELMDAAQARQIYEEIVRRRADPALIELAGHGLLRARVFPIEPGQERKVSLRYTQLLDRAGNALQLLYAGSVRAVRPVREDPSLQERPLNAAAETSFEIVVEDGGRFLEPFSPTHALDVSRADGTLRVVLDEDLVGRLSVFFPMAGDALGLSVATHRPAGEDGYFMLTLTPGEIRGAVQPRDITVVMDVSGSMSGEKIQQAREALRGLLGTLGSEDRFRLVSFSNDVRRFAEGWSETGDAELRRARAWVDDLVADGGTNVAAALDEAFRLESSSERLPMVIFLTDGLPSVGEQSPERLAARAQRQAGRARVFAFGVGYDVNTQLLDRLTEAGRGSTNYVDPGENVERAISLLAAKVRHPVLTDVSIDGAPVQWSEIYPVRIPDVFSGEELVLFGRYDGQGEGQVSVAGTRANRLEVFHVNASFPRVGEGNDYLPRLWASRKLGHLMRQIWTEGETQSLRQEITQLALRYGLPSPYTSYLVQEPVEVAQAGGGAFRSMTPQAAPAPPPTVGAQAVRRADRASQFRGASSQAKLAEVEADFAEEMALAPGGAQTRMLSGRLFQATEGVWRDVRHDEDVEVVHVRIFSPAYFKLLQELPELRPVLRELNDVLVAGRAVSVQIGSDGLEDLSAHDLEELVSRFRETNTTR